MFLCIDEVFEGYWCTSSVFNGRVFPKANCGSYGHVWDKSRGGIINSRLCFNDATNETEMNLNFWSISEKLKG